jgi:hypothetical protein
MITIKKKKRDPEDQLFGADEDVAKRIKMQQIVLQMINR